MGKKKNKNIVKAAQARAASKHVASHTGQPAAQDSKAMQIAKEERRKNKLEKRKKDKAKITAAMWAGPAPAHLVGKLDVPKVKSKYQSYFEFAENTEKKKKLEYQVTNDTNPPPGFVFIPFGDPVMTNACKELSRERGAMIFIVSASKEENSKISEFVHRTGCHFRESIVEEARQVVGDSVINRPNYEPGAIEPIPESQEEINKQADAAIRDLFPRIPNTDRQMIIEHAFQKGVLFHGEPTVGLQADLPLSRRVQLAVLAHIRHTHTRYDKLLRETSWVNARKVVESVCLDFIFKWRGDEETGRDQMDEILREVVVITDSEDEGDSSSEDDSSDEEGEISSTSSPELLAQPTSRNQHRPALSPGPQDSDISSIARQVQSENRPAQPGAISSRTRSRMKPKPQGPKKTQRGFKRYQAAWDDALHRQQDPSHRPLAAQSDTRLEQGTGRHPSDMSIAPRYSQQQADTRPTSVHGRTDMDSRRYAEGPAARMEPSYSQRTQPLDNRPQRDQVIVRQLPDHYINQGMQPHRGIPVQSFRDNRPSQVVSGSSHRHGFQDLLVPSIESTPSDVTRTLMPTEERHPRPETFGRRQDSYPRQVIESRRLPPPQRQFIVIDDDSPQNKRRRVVHEEDSGRFRPLPSHEHGATSIADSHLPSPSSLPLRRSSPGTRISHDRPSPSMSGAPASSYITASGRSIPIYDVPDTRFIGRPPEHFRRAEVYDPAQQNGGTVVRHLTSAYPVISPGEVSHHRLRHESRPENFYSPRPVEDAHGSRQVDSDYQQPLRRSQTPNFPVQTRVSRSYDAGVGRDVIDQAFIHNFSQSRINGSVHVGEASNATPSSRPVRSAIYAPGFRHDYEEQERRAFPIPVSTRARPPLEYTERPMYEHEIQHRPVIYEDNRRPAERFHGTQDQAPIFIRERTTRPLEPVPAPYRSRQEPVRRQVVVLD